MTDTLLSFAYGSNMSSAYLRETCPSAVPVGRAQLPNVAIEFRRFSTDLAGGISTTQLAPGAVVWGVLFEIARAEIEALDLLEDVDKGLYLREGHLVLDEVSAWRLAQLYRVARPEGPFAPSAKYLEWVRAGAAEHGLLADYIRGLERLGPGV